MRFREEPFVVLYTHLLADREEDGDSEPFEILWGGEWDRELFVVMANGMPVVDKVMTTGRNVLLSLCWIGGGREAQLPTSVTLKKMGARKEGEGEGEGGRREGVWALPGGFSWTETESGYVTFKWGGGGGGAGGEAGQSLVSPSGREHEPRPDRTEPAPSSLLLAHSDSSPPTREE